MKTRVPILLLLTVSAFGQLVGKSMPDESSIPWQPFTMEFPEVAPQSTVPKEMVSALKVANWPITLETTKLTDAQRRFGGPLGHSGDAGDALGWLCLYQLNARNGWVLWLTSSEIDGESIGGFVWLRMSSGQKIDSRCKALNSEQGMVTSPVPLRLGMTKLQVEQLLGKPSGRFRNTFMYFHEHEGTIRNAPYTWDNSIDIVYRNGVVWAIHTSLTISS